jgi:ATP-dependent RNA helicase RhlE
LTSFTEFGLLPPILQALASEGYTTPTPIQSQAIPHILAGRDLCGIAQTGTGKTAAFALPILQRLSGGTRVRTLRACRALVLSPTRELASQIADSFRAYRGQLRLSTATVFGGVPLGAQQRQLAPGVDILVATPGRLLDLIDRNALTLAKVEILVLDEADRMLDLGFVHALKRIVKLLPSERQTLLFSATMPKAIAALAEDYLDQPVKVAVAPVATTAERVDQSVVFVPAEQKRRLLASLLQDPAMDRVLVFTRTKHGADRVVRHLAADGIEASAIHGNKSQPQRERALAGFRGGRTRVLVATDIAARGIDVDDVSHVINFELPNVPEDYVHRIGRTARAGAAGSAIAFCSGDERAYLRDIEKLIRLPIRVLPFHGAPTSGNDRAAAAAERASHRPSVANHPQRRDRPQAPNPGGNRDRGRRQTAGSGDLPAFLQRDRAPANPNFRRRNNRRRNRAVAQ